MERILGATLTALASSHFADIARNSDPQEGRRLFQQMVDGERDSFVIDNHMPGANGQNVSIRWTAWSVPGSDGKAESSLVIAQDNTERLQFEQRLNQAERLEAFGRLAAGVAHDFNNLLTGVLLYCDLLLVDLDSSHRQRKYVEEIRAAGLQASALVRQLLAVARPRNAEPQLLSLNDVIEGLRTLLCRLIGENIQLQFELDKKLGLVRIDPTQAQQVFLNLVLNSRDALGEGGHILVQTCNCNLQGFASSDFGGASDAIPCALLLVSDNGKGMDPETRRHLFEAFFTTKAASHGTGLGLSTVHDIVKSSGGLIHVDSEPGHGTRVSVLLPLAPDVALPSMTHDIEPKTQGAPPLSKEDVHYDSSSRKFNLHNTANSGREFP